MIIVEGPDGAGKTTLVEQLADDFSLAVSPKLVDHEMRPMADVQEWLRAKLTTPIDWTNPVIYDRFPLISEPIYGPIYRGTVASFYQDRHFLFGAFEALEALNPIYIFCMPGLDVVKANVAADTLNESVRGKIEPVYWQYHFTMARMRREQPLVWNFKTSNPRGAYTMLKNLLNTRLEQRNAEH